MLQVITDNINNIPEHRGVYHQIGFKIFYVVHLLEKAGNSCCNRCVKLELF